MVKGHIRRFVRPISDLTSKISWDRCAGRARAGQCGQFLFSLETIDGLADGYRIYLK